jgi:Protein of unknown function (DUF3105)
MADGGDQQAASGWSRVAGYGVATVAIALATIAVVAMIASFGDSADGDDTVAPDPAAEVTTEADAPELLPDGGLFDIPDDVDGVEQGARIGGCELKSFRVASRDHVAPGGDPVRYSSSPPTSGRHYPTPAQDGAYEVSPDVGQLVHTLEHGRVIVWFKRDLPAEARASLKAYYDHDSPLMVLVPDTTGMEYDVAATAWNGKPGKHGTGRLLGCREYSGDVYTAIEAFKDRNRGKGPELVP